MKKTAVGILLLLAMAGGLAWIAGGCGSEEGCKLTGDDRSFGDCCEEDSNCASGVCHEFGQLGLVCTESCTDDSTCPEGADGTKKCNAQNVCRP